MTIQSVAWALDQDLPAKAKMVLVALCNHADHTDGRCHIAPETIAREGAIRAQSLGRYLGALDRNGYLVRPEPKKIPAEYFIEFDREPRVEDFAWIGAGDDDVSESGAASATPADASSSRVAPSTAPKGFSREKRPAAPAPDAEPPKVFVIEGSKAWNAWIEYRKATGVVPQSLPTCNGLVGGRMCRGWNLPSLFPPAAPSPALNRDDADALAEEFDRRRA